MDTLVNNAPVNHNDLAADVTLSLDGYSLIEQCTNSVDDKGTMYLQDNLLLLILEGNLKVNFGKESFQVSKYDMLVLNKATLISYESTGNPENNNRFYCLMISLKDDLIKNFITSTDLKIIKKDFLGDLLSSVQPMDDCLISFAHGLDVFFKNPEKVQPTQLRRKMMELLYDTAICSDTIFQQILHLQQPARADLREVVESHYTSPIRLEDLAYFSGRSLSSFKRDFQQMFNMPPAAWIREKRLNKAKEMLETTGMTVSDICYSLGFENVSHFSRIFKQYHGIMPTSLRQEI